MDENLNGRGPPEIPSVWSMWVRPGTWGSDHTLNGIFGSPVLASGGRSSDPSWPADKRRADGHNWDWRGCVLFSSSRKSSPEWGLAGWIEFSTSVSSVRNRWGQGSAAFWRGLWEEACKSARATCRLPSHPRCPLTSHRDGPPTQEWQEEKGGVGGKGRECRDQGGRGQSAARTDKDVREINRQKNETFLSNFTYCTSKGLRHILQRLISKYVFKDFSKPHLPRWGQRHTGHMPVRSLMSLRASSYFCHHSQTSHENSNRFQVSELGVKWRTYE